MIRKPSSSITTAKQQLAMPYDGNRYELVNGVLQMTSPAGSEHGKIADRIARRLGNFVEEKKLGQTYAAETGFRIASDPDTVRAPDAAFVSHARLASVEPTRGYLPVAPNLLIEVISPNDTFSEVDAKAKQWIENGAEIVLVADPANESFHVYPNQSEILILRSGETFEAGDVCGGWKLSVDDVFEIGEQ